MAGEVFELNGVREGRLPEAMREKERREGFAFPRNGNVRVGVRFKAAIKETL